MVLLLVLHLNEVDMFELSNTSYNINYVLYVLFGAF